MKKYQYKETVNTHRYIDVQQIKKMYQKKTCL